MQVGVLSWHLEHMEYPIGKIAIQQRLLCTLYQEISEVEGSWSW